MIDLWTLVIFAIVLLLTWIYRTGRRSHDLPPGPETWPYFGNLDLLYHGKYLHVTLMDIGRKYSGLFSLQFYKHPALIISDISIAKEALIDQADIFSDRAHQLSMLRKHGTRGIVTGNGENWKRLRRLAMQSMRDLGVGKATIEAKIQDEASVLIKEIEKEDGKYFTFEKLFNKAVTNIICSVLFNKRYSYDDPEYNTEIEYFNEIVRAAGLKNVFQYLPTFTYILIPFFQPKVKYMLKYISFIKKWIKGNIDEHKASYDESHMRDFVDLYLQAEHNDSMGRYTEEQMFHVLFEMFGAGSETTSTTLLWALVYLTKHPEIQKKCRQELREKIGDRPITYQDKAMLPYIEATICEVQRRATTVPFLVYHNTRSSTIFRGHNIAENTLLNVNVYAVHMDPEHWTEPMKFNPERFLDRDGAMIKPEAFMPFGIGKRACLGEQLAKMELWIFVAELLQKFEFHAQDPDALPTPETTELGVTLIPKQYYVKAKRIV